MRGVSQPTVSRIVTVLVPVVKSVLEEFVPSAEDAIEMAGGRVCLVDGTITPCWSYEDHHELWSRKHGTTGFQRPAGQPARWNCDLHFWPAARENS